jgi:uncharacterized damage-inducible protein DinB
MAELNPWHTHLARLARYNVWATARLLDAVAPPSDADYRREMVPVYVRRTLQAAARREGPVHHV